MWKYDFANLQHTKYSCKQNIVPKQNKNSQIPCQMFQTCLFHFRSFPSRLFVYLHFGLNQLLMREELTKMFSMWDTRPAAKSRMCLIVVLILLLHFKLYFDALDVQSVILVGCPWMNGWYPNVSRQHIYALLPDCFTLLSHAAVWIIPHLLCLDFTNIFIVITRCFHLFLRATFSFNYIHSSSRSGSH